jgi:phosphoribosylformylglycinamidine synthase
MTFRSAVVTFPGSNCDRDMAVALEQVCGGEVHRVWHGDAELPDNLDFIALPGGFSYGDYLRSGAMAARSPIMQAVIAAANRGVTVLGVCNGFQVLTEAGLLPGALLRNAGMNFVCREVVLTVETSQSLFTAGYDAGQSITIPVAHHDGNYFADTETLNQLEGDGVPLRRSGQRLGARYSRGAQCGRQCARHDAASRADDRSRARRHRWPGPLRERGEGPRCRLIRLRRPPAPSAVRA